MKQDSSVLEAWEDEAFVGIDFVECAIIKFLRAEGAEELAPVPCELGWPHTELVGIELIRTTTLAEGGECGDFPLRQPGASDIGIPRASPAPLLRSA